MDLTRQTITFTFDKAVNASTNIPSLYVFQDQTNNLQTVLFSLSSSITNVMASLGHVVVISISNADIDRSVQ